MTFTGSKFLSTKFLTTGILAAGLALGACGEGSGAATPEGGGKHPLVGNPAPSFEVDSLNGQGKVSFDKWKGKVVYVDFWATWCEPCKKSFPKYQELYTKYQSSGLEIIAVSVDDENKGIEAFIKQHGAKFPVAWDDGHKIADQWKPESMPTAFVIDKEGVIRHVHAGYHDGEEAELDKEIKELL